MKKKNNDPGKNLLIKRLTLFLTLAIAKPILLYSSASQAEPWTVQGAARMPDWLSLSVSHRTRFESMSGSFRRTTQGGDQVFAFRTQVSAEIRFDDFRLGGEFIDSRIDGPTSNTPVTNTLVNETELLQAYLAWHRDNLLDTGLGIDLKFGRQTMDIGSRRLVARNRYRNTINNFNGFNLILTQPDRWYWRNFVVLPVIRAPGQQATIREGVAQADQEQFNSIFAGSFLSFRQLPLNTAAELYFFQISESDLGGIQTKNRILSSPGLRWYRKPQIATLDFELETVLQTGTSHASSSAADDRKLNHFSYFGHIALGYTFDLPWQPRFLLQYDYASGDQDPTDGNNGRFETLFGARRFEYGPTSIWGAFARANINTPGIRVQLNPAPKWSAFIAHRAFWLAQRRDTWVGSNLRDPSGASGSFVGQQLEARLRWNPIPKTLRVEAGWARLFKGDFAKNAPGAPNDKSDADYFYVQTSLAL